MRRHVWMGLLALAFGCVPRDPSTTSLDEWASSIGLALLYAFVIMGFMGAYLASRRVVWVCLRCETADRPYRRTKGSILIEIVLWLCFIVPGLIYSIWRLTTKDDVCRSCGSTEIVPIDSPAGRKVTGR